MTDGHKLDKLLLVLGTTPREFECERERFDLDPRRWLRERGWVRREEINDEVETKGFIDEEKTS